MYFKTGYCITKSSRLIANRWKFLGRLQTSIVAIVELEIWTRRTTGQSGTHQSVSRTDACQFDINNWWNYIYCYKRYEEICTNAHNIAWLLVTNESKISLVENFLDKCFSLGFQYTLIWLYKMMRWWEIMFYRSLRRGSAFPSWSKHLREVEAKASERLRRRPTFMSCSDKCKMRFQAHPSLWWSWPKGK